MCTFKASTALSFTKAVTLDTEVCLNSVPQFAHVEYGYPILCPELSKQ